MSRRSRVVQQKAANEHRTGKLTRWQLLFYLSCETFRSSAQYDGPARYIHRKCSRREADYITIVEGGGIRKIAGQE